MDSADSSLAVDGVHACCHANIVAMTMQLQAVWIGFLALVPLIPLLATGLYLFALPHVSRSNANEAR